METPQKSLGWLKFTLWKNFLILIPRRMELSKRKKL
jgi:hypothetical protein